MNEPHENFILQWNFSLPNFFVRLRDINSTKMSIHWFDRVNFIFPHIQIDLSFCIPKAQTNTASLCCLSWFWAFSSNHLLKVSLHPLYAISATNMVCSLQISNSSQNIFFKECLSRNPLAISPLQFLSSTTIYTISWYLFFLNLALLDPPFFGSGNHCHFTR
jgi:hypothetical protein